MLLLNQNKKRGRLKINTAAFIRQPSEAYSQKRITFQASSSGINNKKREKEIDPGHGSGIFPLSKRVIRTEKLK